MPFFTTRALERPTIWGRRHALAIKGNNKFTRIANLTGTELIGHLKKTLNQKLELPGFDLWCPLPAEGPAAEFGGFYYSADTASASAVPSASAETKALLKALEGADDQFEKQKLYSRLSGILAKSEAFTIDEETRGLIESLMEKVNTILFYPTLLGLMIATQDASYLCSLFQNITSSPKRDLFSYALSQNADRVFTRFSFEQRRSIYLHLTVPQRYYATPQDSRESWEAIAYSLIHPFEFVFNIIEAMIALFNDREGAERHTFLNHSSRALGRREAMGIRSMEIRPKSISYRNQTFLPDFFAKVSIHSGKLSLIFKALFDHEHISKNLPGIYRAVRIGGAIYAINRGEKRPKSKPLTALQSRILELIEENPRLSCAELKEKLIQAGHGSDDIQTALRGLIYSKYLLSRESSERGTQVYSGDILLGTFKDSEFHVSLARTGADGKIILPQELFNVLEVIFTSPELFFRVTSGPAGAGGSQSMELVQVQLLTTAERLRRRLLAETHGVF